MGSSPLTRGKPHRSGPDVILYGLIPAHAGKTSSTHPWSSPHRAHPRSRGENALAAGQMKAAYGSSPLTRGNPPLNPAATPTLGLIPAHAGKTGDLVCGLGGSGAHPRSRGENVIVSVLANTSGGSSPLTRGKPRGRAQPSRRDGLIPAHAGKTTDSMASTPPPGAHPRSRGENAPSARLSAGAGGSSPLTRGKPPHACADAPDAGLIPAHAGKTGPSS